MIRAPIEQCCDEFMKEVRAQNKENVPGIQQYCAKIWSKTGWEESKSLTHGKSFYSKKGRDKTQWNKPTEIKNDKDFDEEKRYYAWKKQADLLKDDDNVDYGKHIKSEPFKVITNTFPIKMSQDINVLEYAIKVEANEVQDDDEYHIDVQKVFKKFSLITFVSDEILYR